MKMIEVGAFKYDPESKMLSGPKEYMEERGDEKLEEILSGKSTVANFGMTGASGSPERAVLVALQTDYAGWKGLQSLKSNRG